MQTFGERLAEAAALLSDVTETPGLDAEILMGHSAGLTRARLLARLRKPCEAPDFDALLERRLAHEPLAYILGEWEFFSLTFRVVPPLLVPRPETEHLVEAVLAHVGERPAQVLDLCTGTGCVGIAIARNAPRVSVVATDIDPRALDVAAENAARHDVSNRLSFRLGDLFAALDVSQSPFDVICANPPYVEADAWDALPPVIRLYEDARALLAGPDGLDAIARLAQGAPRFLRPGGMLAFEIGNGQYSKVYELLRNGPYAGIACHRDLAGHERIVTAYFS